MSSNSKVRSPAVLAAIGAVATLVLALGVSYILWQARGFNSLSDNAAIIGALVALGGVLTAQMVSIALDDRRSQESRELEDERAHEAALQNYFEQVGTLLFEKPLRRASPGDNLSTVVRAQTLTVLQGLEPDRKRILLLFLYESGLIPAGKPVVSLILADLRGAFLRGADLRGAFLRGAFLREADLREADLREANLVAAILREANLYREAKLREADLVEADLRGAFLRDADLEKADLRGANLRKADLVAAILMAATLRRANLREANLYRKANLREADLREANLTGADLIDANLEEANLEGANLEKVDLLFATLYKTNLREANLIWAKGMTSVYYLEKNRVDLKGATMPDGSKHH